MTNLPEPKGDAPREISYAFSAKSRAGKVVIRAIENLTGRIGLIRMALGYEKEVSAGRDFWEVMTERYKLNVDVEGIENIPADKPLIVVANHPYGILDGMALGRILSETRGDFRIVANNVFHRSEELSRIILPIDFEDSKAARKINLETRREALSFLADGGTVGIFPGGTVSTARRPFGEPRDPVWRSFTARLVARSDAVVVPIYFHGANSRLFQIASHVHDTLRVALLIKEFGKRVGGDVKATIGKPISRDEIDALASDSAALMDLLRDKTYRLSPEPMPRLSYGKDWDPVLANRRHPLDPAERERKRRRRAA
ncbi:MAG: lysophospholipid acyltransferase family protein [Pseudomonadota bacterium]